MVYRLDGDNIRHDLNEDLGFSDQDRKENIRRIVAVANLMKDAGMVVLFSCISPHQDMREYAKNKIGKDDFVEVYVKASLEACIKRDPKGFYKSKEINNLTGVSSIYEEPQGANLTVATDQFGINDCTNFLYQ